MENQEMKTNEMDVTIPGEVVERILALCEKGMEVADAEKKMKSKEILDDILTNEGEFIKAELNRMKVTMQNTDVRSDEYMKVLRNYDKIMDIVRYW